MTMIKYSILFITFACLTSCAMIPSFQQQVSGGSVPILDEYVPLGNKKAPFDIDVDQEKPFSRWNVPWNDDDVAGVDILWLARPREYADLPEYMLIINNYSTTTGMICLVDGNGKVHQVISNLGLIQKAVLARNVAPIAEQQVIVYSNPCHGPGTYIGQVVLLAFDKNGSSRILLTIPRYEYVELEGETYCLGMPLITSGPMAARVLCPVITVSFRTGRPMLQADGEYVEYEWNTAEGKFIPAPRTTSYLLLSKDAWSWSYYMPGR